MYLKKNRIIPKISQKIIFGLISAFIAVLGMQIFMQKFVLYDLYKSSRLRVMEQRIDKLGEDLISQENDKKQILLDFFEKNDSTVIIFDEEGVVYYDVDEYRNYIKVSTEKEDFIVYIDGLEIPNNISSQDLLGQEVLVRGTHYTYQNKMKILPYSIEGENFKYTLRKVNERLSIVDSKQNNEKDEINPEGMTNELSSLDIVPPTFNTSNEEIKDTNNSKPITGKIIDAHIVDQEDAIGFEYHQARIYEEVIYLSNSIANNTFTIDEHAKVYEIKDYFTELVSIFGVKMLDINGSKYYIATMTYMQMIEETMDMMNIYTIISLIIISLIAGVILFRYSKKFTNSLIELKVVTEKIANLDFKDITYTHRDDEIGELAENISQMSKIIECNLQTLQKDLTKQDTINRQQRDFLNNISHELKTPLTILQGVVYGVDDGIYQLKDRYVMDTLHNQIDMMEELVNQLLGIARFNWKDELTLEPFLLSDLVLKVNHNIRYLVDQKKLNLIVDVDESVVIGSRDKIELVIRNLYSNAIHYTPIGESITITVIDGQFIITNTGVSISGEDIHKVWEPFYKIDSSRSTSNKKTGLGLYIVKQILDRHKARYSITSNINSVTARFILKKVNDEE